MMKAALSFLLACLCTTPAGAVDIFRCAGKPLVYTSDLRLVRSGQCTKVGAQPAAVRPSSTATAARSPAAPPAAAAAVSQRSTIPREVQQQRDSDRVLILQTELDREREHLAQLTQQLRALETGGAARPQALVVSQAVQRSEADVEALHKELARAQR